MNYAGGIVKGAIETGIQLVSQRYDGDPFSTGQTEIVFKGTKEQCIATSNLYFGDGWKTSVASTGTPVWSLTVTFGANMVAGGTTNTTEEPEPEWTIEDSEIEQNLFDMTDRNLTKNLTTKTRALIEYKLKNPNSDKHEFEPEKATDQNYINHALATYNLMRTGVEARLTFQTNVKRVMNVNKFLDVSWTNQYKGKILSKKALIRIYGVPLYKQSLLPESDTALQVDLVNALDTFKGYLQKGISDNYAPGNKKQITQSWVFNKWSAGTDYGLYDIVL